MRIASGDTDKYIYFVARQAADLTQRMTGLNSFTVYRSRNGAAAAAMTTPTVNEVDSTNLPGVYELLVDEDTDISGEDSEEMVLHITGDDGVDSMAPVTRTIEIYTPSSGGSAPSAADVADAVWDEARTGHATAGTFGEQLDAAISSRLASASYTAPLDASGVRSAVGLASANLDTQLAAIPTLAELQSELAALNDPDAAAIADAVWDEAAAGHVGAGSFGEAVGDALADTNELQTDWANGGRLDLLIDAIKAATDNLPSDPADASVIAGRFDTLDGAVADLPTNAELDAALAGLNDIDAAGVRAAVGLATANLDTQLAALPTLGELQTELNNLNDLDGDGVAVAVWDALTADHMVYGSFGEFVQGISGGSAPTVEEIRAEMDANSTKLADILDDTNELQGDWADGGRLDLILDARASQASVDAVPTNAELTAALGTLNDPDAAAIADAIWDEPRAGHVAAGSFGEQLDASVSSRASQSSLDDVPTNAELTAALNALNDLDAAGVRAAVGLAAANLDTQLTAIDTAVGGVSSDVWAEVIDNSLTAAELFRGLASVAMAKWALTGGTLAFRDLADTKDRVSAAVTDTSRGAPTLDLDP